LIKAIFDEFMTVKQMEMCSHIWDTQMNESLNQSIANFAPKTHNYSTTMLLHCQISMCIGLYNFGPIGYYTKLFDELNIDMGMTMLDFLGRREEKVAYDCKYQNRFHVKCKYAFKQQTAMREANMEAQIKNQEYGSGMGLQLGIQTQQ